MKEDEKVNYNRKKIEQIGSEDAKELAGNVKDGERLRCKI
jgi:hypothetical protein